MYIGYHINIIDNLLYTLKHIKYNAIQFFLKDISKESNKNLILSSNYAKINNILLIIHSAYIINIATNFDITSIHIITLLQEFKIAEIINNIYGIVIHTGKKLNLPINNAYNNMYMTIIYILKRTNDTLILLETPSGQGTEMCSNINKFIMFYDKLKHYKRIKICIDTCHVFAAGYDPYYYIKKIIRKFGINSIGLIHYNDSKYDIGSRKDRHMPIGKGYIKNIKKVKNIAIKHNIPIILEI